MQEMPHFVVAECPDHRGRKTEGNCLEHQAFGGVACPHLDIATPAVPILDRCALEGCGNADHRRRGGDPFLAARGIDKLFALMTGGY